MSSHDRKILLLVEGKSTEVALFSRILDCFPEIAVKKQNILVYNTNLWKLQAALVKEFGETWYEEEIDFLGFLKSSPVIRGQITNLQADETQADDFQEFKFTDIFLVFDYERQDPSFDAAHIQKMLTFWSESTENGLLYINYPMVESYKHLKRPLPDLEYLGRKCECSALFSEHKRNNQYKAIVGSESGFTDLRKYTREIFQAFVIHNLCKAAAITGGTADISIQTAKNYWKGRNYSKILDVQNQCSLSERNGFVYVLATCLSFIPEYNSNLLE